MKHIERILIAVDLDKDALEIIEYGITLSMIMQAEVDILHVSMLHLNDIDTSDEEWVDIEAGFAPSPIITLEEKLKHDTDALEFMVREVKRKMDIVDTKIPFHVVRGITLQTILEELESQRSHLLVVGMKSQADLSDLLFGSLTNTLIDKCPIPIVLVPSSYVNRNLDKIAMAINFDFSEIDILLNTLEWCHSAQLGLSLFHVEDDQKNPQLTASKIDTYRQLIAPHVNGINFEIDSKVGRITDIMNELSHNDGADLIIMHEKKRHWNLLPAIYESSSTIARKINVPLLLWKN